MGTKFCFGNSPISSGYAIGYFGIAIRLFLIPNLIALASYKVWKMHKIKDDMEAESEAESDAEPEGEAAAAAENEGGAEDALIKPKQASSVTKRK